MLDSSKCSTCDAMSTNRGWEEENRRGTVMVPGGGEAMEQSLLY